MTSNFWDVIYDFGRILKDADIHKHTKPTV